MTFQFAVFFFAFALAPFFLAAQSSQSAAPSDPPSDSPQSTLRAVLTNDSLALCGEPTEPCRAIADSVDAEFGVRADQVLFRLAGTGEFRIYDIVADQTATLWPGQEPVVSVAPHPTDLNRYAILLAVENGYKLVVFDAESRTFDFDFWWPEAAATGDWELESDTFVPDASRPVNRNRPVDAGRAPEEFMSLGLQSVPAGVPVSQPNLKNLGYSLPINTFHKVGEDSDIQCTRYAWGRVFERTGVKLEIDHSAGERHGGRWLSLIRNAATGSLPRANAVAVFSIDGNPYGHVGFVEFIQNGRVLLSDANMDGDGKFSGFRWRTFAELQHSGKMHLLGFIYPGETPATLISPSPNAQLTAASVELRWSMSGFARGVEVSIGSAPGNSQFFGFSTTAARSVFVSGLPTDGRNLYVRLKTYFETSTQHKDFVLKAADLTPAFPGVLISPVNGSRLAGNSATFVWRGTRVAEYGLLIGSSPGNGNYFGSGVGTATSQVVSGLPTDGRTIYVSLRSRIGNIWSTAHYTVVASNIPVIVPAAATISAPSPGSILPGPTQQFTWSAGSNALEYSIRAGSTPGGSQYYSRSTALARSAVVSGLPSGGKTIYVRLGTRLPAGWTYRDYLYRSR